MKNSFGGERADPAERVERSRARRRPSPEPMVAPRGKAPSPTNGTVPRDLSPSAVADPRESAVATGPSQVATAVLAEASRKRRRVAGEIGPRLRAIPPCALYHPRP